MSREQDLADRLRKYADVLERANVHDDMGLSLTHTHVADVMREGAHCIERQPSSRPLVAEGEPPKLNDRIDLRFAAQTVLDRFRSDESAGYRSRDRQFAIELLGKALDTLPASSVVAEGEGERLKALIEKWPERCNDELQAARELDAALQVGADACDDTCPRCRGSFEATGGKPTFGPFICQRCAAEDYF